MEFLQAVARGRGTAFEGFKDWFPDFSKNGSHEAIGSWISRMDAVWGNDIVLLFMSSKDDCETYNSILRYMVRAV